MIRFLRAAGALAAVALTLDANAVAAPPAAVPAAASVPPIPADVWPQTRSDVAPDPDIRFGVLANGMRYAIRKQAVPPGQAALRLWIGSGSLQETDAQAGLAHFLEHMAFAGSKSVKKGEMVKMLERLGLAFGPDTNASTGFEATVYKLDLPRVTDETLDTSLMLFRETASNLTIAPEAVDAERGVVLSEERARDTPAYRIAKQRLKFLLQGQRIPERMPIGRVEVLKTAPAGLIRDYYQAYYRPDRAVLVAVGDFDPAQMEAKIRARFSDWRPAGPPGPDPDLGRVRLRGTEARLVVEPGAPLSLQLAWAAPPDLAPDSAARRRRDLVEMLGFSVLNRRFSALARAPSPPFIGASAAKFDQNRSAELTLIGVVTEPGRWREGLSAAEQEQRRLVQYGVRQDELDREIVELRARLKAAAAGAATRRPVEIAEAIVNTLDDRVVVTSPAQDLAQFERDVQGLTADEVSAALRHAFQGAGPLLFAASPQPIEGGERTLLAALDQSRKVAVAPPPAPPKIEWPYASFGAPGRVAERRAVADLGVTMVRFENGVRLTVKPTGFRDDEVLVRANIGQGLLGMAADRQSAAWAANAFIEGGLKRIDNEDMERVLAAKVYGARFSAADDAFVLAGSTRTEDLPTELEVLAGYVADPGWRPEAFERLKASGKTIHDQYEATDAGVLARDLGGLLRAGDRRWTFPSREAIRTAELEQLKAQVEPSLADGPIELVVVGDVDVDKVVDAVGRTFGALPPRAAPAAAPASARRLGFPAPTPDPVVLTHKGRADQSIAYIAWPTTDYWADPQRARATAVLGEILRSRLFEQLRQTEGATYSPSVSYHHSLVWSGWGYLAASVEVPPQKIPTFFQDVARIAADLRAKPVSADELARAKEPRVRGLQRAQATNQYWLSELSGAQADPRRLDISREIVAGTERVTAEEVRQAAETFLKDDKAFRLIVRPRTMVAGEAHPAGPGKAAAPQTGAAAR